MACSSCEKRRKEIQRIYKQQGIKGVGKNSIRLGVDILKNPPSFLTLNGKKVDGKS